MSDDKIALRDSKSDLPFMIRYTQKVDKYSYSLSDISNRFVLLLCISVVTPPYKPLKQPIRLCHISDHRKWVKYKLQQSTIVNVLGNEYKFNLLGIQFRFLFSLTMVSFTVF